MGGRHERKGKGGGGEKEDSFKAAVADLVLG